MVRKVSFRIRREYFDMIVKGEKKQELRKYSDYWKRTLLRVHPEVAVFVCGKDVHRRKIVDITVGKPEDYLGRELSEQGKKDIPTEMCNATHLGDALK